MMKYHTEIKNVRSRAALGRAHQLGTFVNQAALHIGLLALALTLFASLTASESDARAASGYELRVTDRPVVQRGFLPEASPRSIAVGLPGGLSYCFDAATCRLRYAWSGGFLNMRPTWHERGAAPPVLLGRKFFSAADIIPWRVGDKPAPPRLKFSGYALIQHLPEFRYSIDGIAIKERIEAAPGSGLRCVFTLSAAANAVFFKPPDGARVTAAGHALKPGADGWVEVARGGATKFECLIPGPPEAAALKTPSTSH